MLAADAARVSHREPLAPPLRFACTFERGAATIRTVTCGCWQSARRRGAGRQHDRAQCEPRSIHRMNDELRRRQRAEPCGDGESLKRQERAVVLAMRKQAARIGQARARVLDVVFDRMLARRQRRVAASCRQESRPQRAGVADEPGARTIGIHERVEPGQARDRVRIEWMQQIEPGISELRKPVHASRCHDCSAMASSRRACASASRADR
jgi:hypothetical protein